MTAAQPKLSWIGWLTVCLAAVGPGTEPARGQFPPAPVVVAPLAQRSVLTGQTFVGTVTPTRRAVIGSAVSGRVVEFPINEGDRVAQGQPLAQLLTATISLELAAAVAELRLRTSELEELQNGARPEELQQAEAAMFSAQAQQEYLVLRRGRVEELLRSGGAAAQEERDQAVAEAISAEQEYRRAVATRALVVSGPREERIAQAQARQAVQQAVVDKLQDQIKKYTVISRFDGYVVAEHTEVGEWLEVGAPVAEIAALDEVDVVAQVVENHVPFVRPGMSVRIELPALPHEVFTGRVVSVTPQGDIRSRTFPVKVRVPNVIGPDGPSIKSGMYARVMLPTGDAQQTTLTSKDAIVLGGPQPVVFVVQQGPDGKLVAQPVPVRLGVAEQGLIQIEGDIPPTAQIVVQGNERLRAGQEIVVSQVQSLPDDDDRPSQP